jgi:hypothetical protein
MGISLSVDRGDCGLPRRLSRLGMTCAILELMAALLATGELRTARA